jgi:hypothetical protein
MAAGAECPFGHPAAYHRRAEFPLPLNTMIISHRHRFIFFAVPRTGTHAVRRALGQHLGPEDWEQQNLFEKKRLPMQDLADLGHGHISVRQLQSCLPSRTWNSYFKFAVVRNPFDRFVSACFFLARKQPQIAHHANAFMKRAVTDPAFRRRVLVLPQTALLTDGTGSIPLDFVGRFENLQESFDYICEHLGFPRAELENRNSSQHEPYSRYYDRTLAEAVGDIYRTDLETFSYTFDGRPPEAALTAGQDDVNRSN